MVPFVQFKKCEKQSWSVNFSKINIPPWVFYTLFELHKWYQIAQRTTYQLVKLDDQMIHDLKYILKNAFYLVWKCSSWRHNFQSWWNGLK